MRRQNRPHPGALNSLGLKEMKNTASAEAAGCRIEAVQDAKKEILDKAGRRRWSGKPP